MRRLHPHGATIALGIALVLASMSLTLALLVWQTTGARARQQLCLAIYSIVVHSGASVGRKGSPGYAYYQQHPRELAAARRQNLRVLAGLPCKPEKG